VADPRSHGDLDLLRQRRRQQPVGRLQKRTNGNAGLAGLFTRLATELADEPSREVEVPA